MKSRFLRMAVCFAVLLAATSVALPQPNKPKLLSTKTVASRVQAIEAKLFEPNGNDDQRWREREFARLKQFVSAFIIEQLQAEPELQDWQLRYELRKIFVDRTNYGDPEYRFQLPPYVFKKSTWDLREKAPSKPVETVWAVCYKGYLRNGIGGARTVVEAYVVTDGVAHLAGRGGREMNGYDLKAAEVFNPAPGSTAILTNGVREWSSGRALPSAATLYSVSAAGVQKLWRLEAPSIVVIGTENSLFCLEYEDYDRSYQRLPLNVIDCYDIEETAPYRVVRQVHTYRKK